MIDRYEIGERQTSACAMPTDWMRALEVTGALRQTFDEVVVHTPWTSARWPLPWTFSTFDYRELCSLLFAQGGDVEFETAKVEARAGGTMTSHPPRRAHGAADPRRARLAARTVERPDDPATDLPCPAAWRSIRPGLGATWNSGSMPRTFAPACVELPGRRRAAHRRGRFWPEHHVKEPTVRLAGEFGVPPSATGATGSRTSSGQRSRTACSSQGTRRATASRSRPRGSGPGSTSAWPRAARCASRTVLAERRGGPRVVRLVLRLSRVEVQMASTH